jgi:predicted glycosyltransferase involved in capsule biosynthesis
MKAKYKLQDTTFIIPVRIDTVVRLENLILSTSYLLRNFVTNIIVLEAAEYENGLIDKMLKGITYSFVEDRDPVFYRTKYLNQMTKLSATPFVAVWDADVIVPEKQIIESVEKLRNGTVDMIYPFDGHFYDVSDPIRELYLRTGSINMLKSNTLKMELTYGDNSVGGAFIVNKKSYMETGMENERFYGWGPEDGERFCRWKVMGLKVEFNRGNLYHLSHPRGSNSTFRSAQQAKNTRTEFALTQQSSKEEIKKLMNLY